MSKANFSIEDFRSAIFKDSLARTNRFEVFITTAPRAYKFRDGSNWNLSLYCEMASFPPINIFTKSFKIFGPSYQRPFGAEYGGEGISLTFHIDRDMKVKSFFDDWASLVVDPISGTVGWQDEYVTDLHIRQLDEQENVTYEVKLMEAFPRSVNLLELNNSAQNQTHRLNVLFGYRTWESLNQSNRLTPTDVPRQILNPQVPVVDSRVDSRTRQFNPANGNLEYDTPGSDLPISA
jgi:hypothetical protein